MRLSFCTWNFSEATVVYRVSSTRVAPLHRANENGIRNAYDLVIHGESYLCV